jgi:hypothetical protein
MLQTRAHAEGNHWVISGTKWLITGAQGAAFGIIMARTGEHATMFLTDMRAPGIHIERVLDTMDESMPGGAPRKCICTRWRIESNAPGVNGYSQMTRSPLSCQALARGR